MNLIWYKTWILVLLLNKLFFYWEKKNDMYCIISHLIIVSLLIATICVQIIFLKNTLANFYCYLNLYKYLIYSNDILLVDYWTVESPSLYFIRNLIKMTILLIITLQDAIIYSFWLTIWWGNIRKYSPFVAILNIPSLNFAKLIS